MKIRFLAIAMFVSAAPFFALAGSDREYSCFFEREDRVGRSSLDKGEVYYFRTDYDAFETGIDPDTAKCGMIRVYLAKNPCSPKNKPYEEFVAEDFIVVEELKCDDQESRHWIKRVVKSKRKKKPHLVNSPMEEFDLESGFTCAYDVWRLPLTIAGVKGGFRIKCQMPAFFTMHPDAGKHAIAAHVAHEDDFDFNHPTDCPQEQIEAVSPPVPPRRVLKDRKVKPPRKQRKRKNVTPPGQPFCANCDQAEKGSDVQN